MELAENLAEDIVARYSDKEVHASDWDLNGLREALYHQFNLRLGFQSRGRSMIYLPREVDEMARADEFSKRTKTRRSASASRCCGSWKRSSCCRPSIACGRIIFLNMDHLKEGIGLRGYGQKNPLQEYQKEGYDMFEDMIHRNEEDVVQKLFTVELARETVAPQESKCNSRAAKNGVKSRRRSDRGPARRRRRAVRVRRWAATILVHAAAARNTNAVTASNLSIGSGRFFLGSKLAVSPL